MLKRFSVSQDVCPVCKKALATEAHHFFSSHVTKQCPDGHYEKEQHPALEIPVEVLKQ
ncbi:hypothetical protein [Ectobacillus ponti]|uniref:Uncharacterized protein n=1 Tax=Ectobacillus ponti TaxID=2961894 RepID=A0AA41XDP6_9BACI|nr:hypothetical protein [Ectobacillus ponti]MCP8970201.1 hypothetical protein [Ectobacillus ponti]